MVMLFIVECNDNWIVYYLDVMMGECVNYVFVDEMLCCCIGLL